jgi:hypothetical protein
MTRAPGERNVSDNGPLRANYVSLRWSEANSFGGQAFYKHLAPNGAKANNVLLHIPVESTSAMKINRR